MAITAAFGTTSRNNASCLDSQDTGVKENTGDIAARSVESGYEAELDWVVAGREDDRYRRSCRLGRNSCGVPAGDNHDAPTANLYRPPVLAFDQPDFPPTGIR